MDLKRPISIFLLTLLTLALTTSCGGRKEGKTTTRIYLSGAIGGVGTSGGAMLYGRNIANPAQNFGIFLPPDMGQPVRELPNGLWEFMAITWSTTPLEGEVRCGSTPPIGLNGQPVGVPLVLSLAGCDSPLFGPNMTKSGMSQPNPLHIVSCADRESVEKTYPSDCVTGKAKSFMVRLPEFQNNIINPAGPQKCVNNPAYPNAQVTTPFRIPAITIAPGLGVPLIVQAYDNLSCAGDFEDYILPQGLFYSASPRYKMGIDMGRQELYLLSDYCRNFNPGDNFANGNDINPADGTNIGYNIICTPSHFMNMGLATFNNARFLITRDLLLSSNITNGGILGNLATPFRGIIRGEGHIISNGVIDPGAQTDSIGMVRALGSGGQIRDLVLDNWYLNYNSTSINKVGFAVGKMDDNGFASIEDVSVENSTLSVMVSSYSSDIGAVVGYIGSGSGAGGNSASHLQTFNNQIGAVGDIWNVGGVVGRLMNFGSQASLRSSYSEFDTITVDLTGGSGPQNVGGVVGHLDGSQTEATGVVSNLIAINYGDGSQNIGGVIGKISGGRAEGLKAIGTLTSIGVGSGVTSYIGGIVGQGINYPKIRDSYADVDVLDSNYSNYVGGGFGALIGSGNPTDTAYLFADGNVSCNGSYCGGLAGEAGEYYLDFVGAKGDVFGNAGNYVGGLIGKNSSHLESCYAKGDVFSGGSTYVGGLTGSHYKGFISNCYTTGDVAGFDQVAGLVGQMDNSTTTVTMNKVYVAGVVSGSSSFNAIIGSGIGSAVTPSNCVFESAISGSAIGGCSDTALTSGASFAGFGGSLGSGYETSVAPPILIIEDVYSRLGGYKTGSEVDPYIITGPFQLASISANGFLMNKNFSLGANIDLTPVGEFPPIGDAANPFMGRFRGNNYRISNLTISDPGNYKGLFGYISAADTKGGAKISGHYFNEGYSHNKIFLDNVNINSSGQYVGALVGYIDDSPLTTTTGNHGAIEISGVEVSGFVSGTGKVAGIIGGLSIKHPYARFSDLNNNASVNSSGNSTGGIIGHAIFTSDGARMSELLNRGAVSSSANHVGGIAGFVSYTGTGVGSGSGGYNVLEFAANLGNISGGSGVGGIAGHMQINADVLISSGSVTGTNATGGIYGEVASSGGSQNLWLHGALFTGGVNPGAGSKGAVAASNSVNLSVENVVAYGVVQGLENGTTFTTPGTLVVGSFGNVTTHSAAAQFSQVSPAQKFDPLSLFNPVGINLMPDFYTVPPGMGLIRVSPEEYILKQGI